MPTRNNPYMDLVPEIEDEAAPAPGIETAPVPMATSQQDANPYMDIVPSVSDTERQMRAAMNAAWQHDPERVGAALGLSRRTGLPSDYVERNFDDVVRGANFNALPFREIEERSPALATWLRDHQNAVIARDDLDPLRTLELASKQMAQPTQYGMTATLAASSIQGFNELATFGAAGMWTTGMMGDDEFAEMLADSQRKSAQLAERVHPSTQQYQRLRESRMEQYGDAAERRDEIADAIDLMIERIWTGAETPEDLDMLGLAPDEGPLRDERERLRARIQAMRLSRQTIMRTLENNPRALMELTGSEVTMAEGAGERREALIMSVIDWVTHPRGAAADTARNLPHSTPGLTTGTAAGLLAIKTGPGAMLAFGAANTAAQAPVEYGAWFVERVMEEVEDPTDAQQILAVLRNPAFVAHARGEAAVKGVVHSVIEGAGNVLAGGVTSRVIRGSGGSRVRRGLRAAAGFGLDTAVQVGAATAGEAGGQFAATGEVDWFDVLQEGLGEIGAGMAMSGAGLTVRRVADASGKVMDAVRVVSSQDAMLSAIESARFSRAAGRSPDAVKELLRGSIGSDRHMFFQPEAWRTMWEQAGRDPAEMAAEMGIDSDAYTEAMREGTEISVPAADYVVTVAQMRDVDPVPFTEDARIEDMTPREAKTLAKEARGQIEAAQGEIVSNQEAMRDEFNRLMQDVDAEARPSAADAQAEATIETFSRSVAKQVEMELQRAGQDRNLARRNASLMTAYWTTMARRSEMPLETLREMQPMIIGAARYSRADAMLDRLRAESMPTDADMFGPSLTDFIVQRGGLIDQGGELGGLEAGRARPGLVNKNGMTLDRAGEAAAEAGFPVRDERGDFDSHMLIDALANDMAGNRVNSAEFANDPAIQLRQEMDELSSMLDRMGIDIHQMTNEEVRRALEQRMGEGEGFAQVSPDVDAALENLIVNELEDSQVFSRELPNVDEPTLEYVAKVGDFGGFHVSAKDGKTDFTVAGPRELFFHNDSDEAIGFARMTGDGETVSINMIAFTDENRGQGHGSAFYRYLLNDVGVNVRSDKQITEGTAALYRGLSADHAARVNDDGTVTIISPANEQTGFAQASPMTDTITIDDVDRSTVNSNGQRIAATEEGARNFWAWFGDSKVVDDQGRPLVVYHATDSTFETFDRERKGEFTDSNASGPEWAASARAGFWFSSSDVSDAMGVDGSIQAYLSIADPSETNLVGLVDSIQNRAQAEGISLNESAETMAESMGVDGFIVEDSEFNVVSFIATNAHQIKSATANRGTFDPDSDSILLQPAQPRLTAQHNLSLDNLRFADGIGGLAVPSIGVMPEGSQMDGFGDITLIGGRGFADPAQVPVFDADAYTARFPTPVWGKAKVKDADRVMAKLKPFLERFESARRWEYYDLFVNSPDGKKAIEYMLSDPAVMAAYLADQGESTDPVMRDLYVWGREVLDDSQFMEWMNAQDWSAYNSGGRESGAALRREARDQVESALKRTLKDDELAADMAEGWSDSDSGELFFNTMEKLLRGVRDMGRQEVDNYATRDVLSERIESHAVAFKAWVEDMVLGIMPDPMVMVGRKKMPYTVDNIVRAMASNQVRGKEHTGKVGEGEARALASKRFRELEEMRKTASEQIMDPVSLEKAREKARETVREYQDDVMKYYKYRDTWDALNDSMKVLADYLGKKRKGEESFASALRKNDFENVPGDVIESGMKAARALLQAPVPYFEAKPQRAVDLSEFSAAVVRSEEAAAAREILDRHGVDVIEYDGTPESRAEALRVAHERHGETLFQEAAGGFNPYTNIITLFQTADRSTFIHEMGHMMLEMNERIVNRLEQSGVDLTEQQQTLVNDFDAAMNLFGLTREQWTRMDLSERRPYHEQFAAAFEVYLMEGRAPSKELRSVFRYFAGWMRDFYRTIKNIITRAGAPPFGMNNDIRGLFDRMLAADDAIESAQAEVSIEPVVTDDPALAEMANEARQAAIDEVQAELMQEISDEQMRVRKELSREIRPAVQAEVDQEQVYVALAILQAKPGTELEGGGESFKLNRESVVELLGERTPGLKKLQRLRAYSREGGLHVNDAAKLLGYRNGEELINALINAPSRKQRVDAIVADRVDAALPSMMETGEIAEVATNTLAKHRRRILQREIEILAERVGETVNEGREKVLRSLLRDRARQEVEGTTIRGLRPSDHLRNERRAAREAIEAAARGDMDAVMKLKRRQQYQQMLHRESLLAQERAQRVRNYLKRVQNPTTQKRLAQAGETYLDRVENMLEGVGLQKRSGKYEERRQSLREWLQKPENLESLDAELQMDLLTRSETRNWEDMTLAEFVELHDAVRHVVTQANLKFRLLKNARWGEIRAAIDETVAEMEQNLPLRRLVRDRADRGLLESIRLGMHYYDAEHRVLSSLSRDAGGGQHGAFFDLFVRPLNEAATREQSMLESLAKQFQSLSSKWRADGRRVTDRVAGHTREWRLSVALNWGNVDNRKRLMDGHGMTEAQVQAVLDRLDQTDLEFVQGIFDLIDGLWPELKEVSRRHSGVIPGKVEAEAITTAAGTIPGGYFPIVYDGDQSAAMAAMREESDAMNIVGKTLAASTRKGHRKQRGEGTGKRIQLSLDTAAQHISAVVRDTTHTEVLYDLSRVLQDQEMGSTIDARFGPGVNRAMRKLLQDIASTQVADSKIDGWLRSLRNGVSIAVLGFRIQTVLMQTTAIGSSMRYVGKANFASAAKWVYGDVVSTENRVQWIMEQSDFMRQRYELGRLRETREAVDELRTVPWRRKLSQAAYWAMIKYQFLTVDAPTWTAAYRNEINASGDHGRAVQVADQTVTDSQGGGRTVDLAGAQRSRALQLFTVFGTFFYRQYNQQREIFSDLQRDGVTVETSLKAAHDFFLVTILNAAMVTTIKMGLGAMRGDDIDEDEIPAAIASQLGNELISTTLGGFTGIRELTSATQGFAYSGPAGAMGLDALHSAIGQASRGNFGESFATSSMLATGVFFKLPTLQFINLVKGLDHMIEEEDPNPAPLLLGRPRQ